MRRPEPKTVRNARRGGVRTAERSASISTSRSITTTIVRDSTHSWPSSATTPATIVRLFIHAHDGDRIELHLPDARACEQLRDAGVELLGPQGGAEPLPDLRKTRGVEPLEV